MDTGAPVRWGILGTAGIAESAFLPALAEAGGEAVVVGSRDGARAARWAAEHGVAAGVEGYRTVLEDPAIEAVYIPLPNGLHAEWTIAALDAGKTVFCEKPLCSTPEETTRVLAAAAEAPGPLWEAFVFPFHQQMGRLMELLAGGSIGEVREVSSRFHFLLRDPKDVRLLASLSGGSVQDVGCYPIRLARLVFGAEPEPAGAIADAVWGDGVDVELWGALRFDDGRRLVLSCGFRSGDDTFSRVLGTEGEIRMTNPFHPGTEDTLTVVRDGAVLSTELAVPSGERSFTPAIRHIQRVIRGLEEPQHLAVDEAAGNAAAISGLLAAADSTGPGRVG